MNTKKTIRGPAGQKMAKFLYHLQLYCIAWDSGRYESMTSTFYLHQGVSPTEIGTLTNFLAANVTLTCSYKPQDQDDLYHTCKHLTVARAVC